MKKTTATTAFTVAKFAQLSGQDRHELAARLQTAKARPAGKSAGQGADLFSLRDLVRAACTSGELHAARLAKITSETLRLDLQNARSQGELVEIGKVTRLGQRVLIAVRNRILAFPLTDDEKDACLRELLALKDMDWSRDA
ncbi:MAG: hypothetical protein NTW21_44825 [Verrucomicrobia bacterium]|nr:hypothetical protein [Verrucomicrobiota bacterium]